jgi:ABC-type transport system substrate-binding protein
MEKKNIAIIVLAIALAASGVGNIVLGIGAGFLQFAPPEKKILRVLRGSGPSSFDGLNQWDVSSGNVIDQVVEPLWTYDLTNLSYPLIGLVAESYTWPSSTQIRINVRRITFHDGTNCDAEAVKWNFDRIQYFVNATGENPPGGDLAYPAELYYFADGVTPIINRTEVVDTYTLDVFLNRPFSAFPDLMTYTSGAIYSPDSTPATEFMTLDDIPVGTGPFKLESYTEETEARFLRYKNYWRPRPYFDEVVYTYISDTVTINQAMLSLDHDYLGGPSTDFINSFIQHPGIHFYNFTEDTGYTDSCYWYIGLNNKRIPQPVRKALNYAYNFTFLLQEYYEGTQLKGYTPLPPGFPGHDPTIEDKAPYFNITMARMVLQDGNYAPGGWDPVFGGGSESNWTNWDFDGSLGTLPLNDTFVYWRYPGSTYYLETFLAAQQSFEKIGIDLVDYEQYWYPFLEQMRNNPDFYHLWSIGWCPDYLNPLNMLAPLFLNTSTANYCQYENNTLQTIMREAMEETDPLILDQYYKEIQRTVVLRDFVHIPLNVGQVYYVHAIDLKGVSYNSLARLDLYPMYKEEA